jgi:hypothetical protein
VHTSCLTTLSKEKYVKVKWQIKTVCFVPPSNEKKRNTAGMTTVYSQPNPGNALARENKYRQP